MNQPESEDQKGQTTTPPQQNLSMPQYEADRQKALQEAQDEWEEADEAKAIQDWTDSP